MSQTVVGTATVPAHVALLVLAALLAAFVALGIIDGMERTGLTSAPPVGATIVAVIMATYAMCGAVAAALVLRHRG